MPRSIGPRSTPATLSSQRSGDPGFEAVVEADLAILADLAALAERHLPDASLYSLGELVDEFARTIRREQDLVREGRLIERVASQFAGDSTVRPACIGH